MLPFAAACVAIKHSKTEMSGIAELPREQFDQALMLMETDLMVPHWLYCTMWVTCTILSGLFSQKVISMNKLLYSP